MEPQLGLSEWMIILFAVGAMLAAIFALAYPYLMRDQQMVDRVKALEGGEKSSMSSGFRARFLSDAKDSRRRQIQDSIKVSEDLLKQKKKRLTIRALLDQSGLSITMRQYWIVSVCFAVVVCLFAWTLNHSPFVLLGAFCASLLGIPRWILGIICRRRQQKFLHIFPDAIDVMVRGIKAGLPLSEAMRLISEEIPEPVGSEFLEVIEGQRLGITIDQGIERMYDRMPLPEVNFLGIVMAVQAKTGGNLAEALNNLSKILRDRRKMKQKIKALSQEAKVSAGIIGSLPFVICGFLQILNPEYLQPLFETGTGNLLLIGSAIWMSIGVYIMREMINFDF